MKLRFHDQTLFGGLDAPLGERGNCDSACLATFLGVEVGDVPSFFNLDGTSDEQFWERTRWLAARGFGTVACTWPTPYYAFPNAVAIFVGKSPRGDFQHAVIGRVDSDARGWTKLHDPHPSRAFLDGEPTCVEYVFGLTLEQLPLIAEAA